MRLDRRLGFTASLSSSFLAYPEATTPPRTHCFRRCTQQHRRSPPTAAMDQLGSCKVLKSDEVASTQWLRLLTVQYADPLGKTRTWDMVERATRNKLPSPSSTSSPSPVDAIAILARLTRNDDDAFEPQIVLVKQYRPPVDCVTVELPAGLVDKGETPETAALRELTEETGLVGTNPVVSPVTCTSPGLCNETISLVTVDVDLDRPENQTPQKQLDEGEFIETERVPLSGLLARLDQLSREGLTVFTGLHALAVGISMSR